MSSVTAAIRPHIALLLSAGMGHLTPILRLAAMLASHNCHVTLLTPQPPVSDAESTHIIAFLAAYPTINRLDFHLLPYTPPNPDSADPFFVQFEAIIRSIHIVIPLLSNISPPVSAIFSDITSAAGGHQIANHLCIPNYVISTTSARFSSFVSYVPHLIASENYIPIPDEKYIQIPGLDPFDTSNLPPPFFIPNHLFTNTLVSNAKALRNAKAILLNTFHDFEPKTIEAMNNGKDFPQFLAVGPLEPHKLQVGDHQSLPWLDQQPLGSVVYVSFGSRSALSRDQITELRNGLEKSGKKFLWVLKSRIVDKEDKQELQELVSDSFIERIKEEEKGMVVKGWVNQEVILSHPAIGGFVSHCGWNSVMEAAARGIPILCWPLLGDQRVNAQVVESAGLGIWDQSWGWLGTRLVKSDEIAEKLRMLMGDQDLKEMARKIGEKAKIAIEVGGRSHKMLIEIIQKV